MPYLLGGGGGGGGAPLDGGGGGGLALTPLGGFPEDFAPPESKDGISTTIKISYLLLNKIVHLALTRRICGPAKLTRHGNLIVPNVDGMVQNKC